MGIATAYSAHLIGLSAEIVTVEVDISTGLNAFSVVGLGDRAVEEAKDRVAAAIKNSGYTSPKQKNQKVVISLAPADIKKEGPSFDLAMAVAYLSAADNLSFNPENILIFGELSLEGRVRKISGLLPILCQAPSKNFKTAFIPHENISEASLAKGLTIYAVSSLQEIIAHISGASLLTTIKPHKVGKNGSIPAYNMDMSAIRGNETAKRGLEIAAAGAHNVLMHGPPGTGKTMLARGFHSILPVLSYEHSIEVTGIHSAAKTLKQDLVIEPPFRAPHHTASYPSIVGGGTIPKPGEVTLAHRGVLFLDEFPEFDRDVIEALRQPLEDREITISRARGAVTFPAQCILIASMNPCPCGKEKDAGCICTPRTLESYRRRISGPIADRIDIWINVNKTDYEKLSAVDLKSESSAVIRERIIAARSLQAERFSKNNVKKSFNSEMSAGDIEKIVTLTDEARSILKASAEKFNISARGFHRIIKVARTIADLAGEEMISKEHILEALQYRRKIL